MDPFEELFEKALNEIKAVYKEGAYYYIKTYQKKLYYEILRTKIELDYLWKKGFFEEFKSKLEKHKNLFLEGIRLFKEWKESQD